MNASAWTDLGDGVRVRQSRLYAMNSTALLAREHTVLVDPGVVPSELDDIAVAVNALAPEHVTLLLTHAHWDHVLGRAWWPAAPVIAHARFAEALERDEAKVFREACKAAESCGEQWDDTIEPFRPDIAARGEWQGALGPWTLVLRDAFGHAEHQMSVHLPEQKLLIAADMLSDIELPILNGGCAPYRETLNRLLPVLDAGEIDTLVPGHGAIARGPGIRARLLDDLAYLDALEDAVRAAQDADRTLEQTQAAFPTPDRPHILKGSMDDVHRRNLAFTWEALRRSAA